MRTSMWVAVLGVGCAGEPDETELPDTDVDTEIPDTDDTDDTDVEPDLCEPVPDDFCEAVSPGRCYYLDPVNGDDTIGDGSVNAPWRSFVNVNRSIYAQFRPATWTALAPGDVVYLKEGVFDEIYHPGDDSGPDGGGSYLMYFRGLAGTVDAPITIKGFPTHHPVLDPGYAGAGGELRDGSHLIVEGIEIRDAMWRGLRVTGTSGVLLERLWIHDTDGRSDENISGLELAGAIDVEVRDSLFADNYDRTRAAAGTQHENSCNVVLFINTGRLTIHNNLFVHSNGAGSQYSGCGIKYKHASPDPDSRFELYDNTLIGNRFWTIGIGTHHAHVHHNLIDASNGGVAIKDFAGPTHHNNITVEYNTIYGSPGLFVYPTLEYVNLPNGPWPDVTDIVFRRNIVSDPTAQTQEGRTVMLSAYMSDTLFTALRDGISFSENCYADRSPAPTFGFAEATNFGALGSAHATLASWQETYGFDSGSLVVDPQFTDAASGDLTVSASSPCATHGAYEGGHTPIARDYDPFPCD